MKKVISLISVAILVLGTSATSWAQMGRQGMQYKSGMSGEVITLDGQITNVLLPLAILKSDDKEYTVHLGPVWYWQQKNYELSKGAVQLTGVVEEVDGQGHFYPSKIIQGKTTIILDEGSPRQEYGVRSGRYCQDCGMHHHRHHGGRRY